MAILQLPYNLSALFNFNEPDTNEGAMESSDEDFFDLFDFLPENTVTTNYLAKGEDRIQSLLRIKTRRTYSMNDFFKLFSRDQFWKKSNSRKDFTEYLIKTYWKKVIDPFVNTLYKDFLAGQITEQEISEKLQEILGFSISLSQCHDEQVTRLVGATGMPTDCIFQMTVFENEYFLVFGKLKPRNRNRKIYLKDDKRKCILWDSYYLATLAVIERIRIEYKRYIHSIESKDHDLVYMSILDEIARRYQAFGKMCTVYAYEKEQVLYPKVMQFFDKLEIPVKERIAGQQAHGIIFQFSLLQQILPILNQYSISTVDFLCNDNIPEGYLIIIKALMEQHKMQEADERYHRNNTEVANAFMTKKNIPPKHQDYMKESRFLTVYRYIEVDEDCDLDKMQELEKEFLALGDILGKHPYDASIRFRKLGRHHASGLYSPAYQCVCRSVSSGSVDFLEIDGASNTGVDHVRDLTDWLHERPLGKRKIVIIDEVHMLSRQAFNALLKTLEEPPAYALIILCTTEADRIPATIRSRSACYTITQIPEAIICEHLLEVATEFQIRIQPEAAELIASYSGGAMRNALKLLEQLSNGEDEITADVVRSVLGMSEKDELLRIIQAMLSGNYTKLLESLNSIAKSGKSLLSLTEELLNESTSLLLAKTGQPSSSSAIAENYTLERLCELSAKINWLNDELKNAAGSGIAAYIHATKDLNTGESGLAGKLKSLEDQMFRLSAELKSIKSVGFSKPVDTALEAETNIPITSNSSAQPDLPEESVPVLITPSKTSEVAQTETTDFDALFGDWGFDSFDNTDEPGFFESAEETGTSFQETATVSETSAALSAGELAQKSLSERISNDPVIKEKLLSAEWITQEENLLLKVLPEYKEDILLFIAASGIKNITIC